MLAFTERDFRPVILGADITAYSLVRTFYEAYGVKSLVVNMTRSGGPLEGSALADHVYVENFDQADVLVDALIGVGQSYGIDAGRKLLVLGCGDWYVRMLVENKATLEPYFLIPYVDQDLLDRIVRKDLFYATLEELGIPYPPTFVYDVTERTPLDFDLAYPVIAKPADSALYHYAQFPGKKKVFLLHSRAELEQMLANLHTSTYDYKMLIQEFIPGDDTNMRVLTCYSDASATVRFASAGHTLLEEHIPSAIGNPCAIINERNDLVVEDATRFLEHIGYTGFSNFDIKYDERDHTFRFFEINVRLGRSNYYVTANGHNVAAWMVRELVYGESFDGMTIAEGEHLFTFVPKYVIKTFVHDQQMRAKALELYRRGAWSDPQYYPPDLTWRRRAYITAYRINQIRKFHHHLGRRRG